VPGELSGLLDFSRQRPIQREIIQVNDVVKNSVDLLAYELNSHNIKLETELSPDLPPIMADPHQLQQVFVNLIQNAWQAMSAAHGEGCLAICTETGPSQYSAMSPDKSKVVRICFKDDGPGIPDDVKDRIFDPFFTTKPEGTGTGLGLSICHGIVTEHGGYIWVENPAGQGVKFVVELPVSSIDESVTAKPVDRQTLASSANNSRILVLDDEPNIQSVLAQSLQRRGYEVDIASNGLDGLAYLSRTSYDLILCDIRMPGINGVDFYREVQAKDKKVAKKIIFITGDTANKMTRDFIEENQVKCLRKPFELADLLQVIRLAGEN
jgi:CheY-like chemotaxis protein